MTTAGKVLDLARSHLGYVEGPKDNETPFGAWTGTNFQPWCNAFTSKILDEAGIGRGKLAYVPATVAYYRDKGRLFTTPQPGDEFMLYFPSKGRYAHIGFVESVDGDFIWTIEGNTNAQGSRTGGMVARLRRKWAGSKTVFGRPNYEAGSVAVGYKDDKMGEDVMEAVVIPRAQGGYIVAQAKDGGVFTFDGAPYHGSIPEQGATIGMPVVGGAWTPTGEGYWLVTRDGALYAFGDAQPITGANVDPLKTHLGSRRVVGLAALSNSAVKIIAAEKAGDFDSYDAAA